MAKKTSDAGAAEVQKTVDAETDAGYVGTAVDPTPNEAYTATGSGKTPETDEQAARLAEQATREAASNK